MKVTRILLLLFLASSLHAQSQTVPVTIPQQMQPVPVTINGLPAGCSWSATGGAQIVVTVSGCSSTAPTVTGVTVTGPTTVAVGGTATFTATVQGTNSPSQGVTWSVALGSGSITPAGVFTAPTTAGIATIKATSVMDSTKVGSAAVTIAGTTPPPSGPVIGGTFTIVSPCPDPCHMWPGATAGGGVTGTAIPLTAGATGTVIGGPVTTGNLNVWWQISTGGQTGWTGASNLVMTGSAPPPSSIQLHWTAPASPSLLGFNIYRGTAAGQEALTPIGCAAKPCPTPTVPATVFSYTDTNVQHGTTYFYTVTAVGDPAVYATPESAPSAEASALFSVKKSKKLKTTH